MAILHEDIFGGGKAIEIIVRWHDILITDYNNRTDKITSKRC